MRTDDKYYFAAPGDLGEGRYMWQPGKGRWVRLMGPPVPSGRGWQYKATDSSGEIIEFPLMADQVRVCHVDYTPPAWRPEALYSRADGIRKQAEKMHQTANRMFALAYAIQQAEKRKAKAP